MIQSTFPNIISVNEQRCNLSNLDLRYDESCLMLMSDSNVPISVHAQITECFQCDLLESAIVEPHKTVPLLIKSRYPVQMELKTETQALCSWEHQFGEQGIFEMSVNDTSCGNLITLQEPVNSLLPLLVLALVYGGLLLLLAGINQVLSSDWYKQLYFRASATAELANDLGSPSGSEGTSLVGTDTQQSHLKQRSRVKSLDTFRGLCIAFMIFVNYGGGKYLYFEHSTWNGLSIADVLFPSFMWIMGVSMVLSMRSQLRSGVTRHQLARRVVFRGLKLIAIGLVLNSLNGRNNLATYRFNGVLQRLGLCYIVVALLEVYRVPLQSPQRISTRFPWMQDLRDSWLQWLITGCLVAAQIIVTLLMPVPGCPTGYLGPGGLHSHGNFTNCTGGAAGYIDRVLLSSNHLYANPTCKKVYRTLVPYDPEGILGHLTGILLVQLGAQAGRVLITYFDPISRVSRWLLWAIFTGVCGGLLCNFSKEGGLIPVNKNLNSISFVMVNASIDFAILAVLYLLIDVKRWWGGGPFYITGMNSLLLYIGHIITNNALPWKWQPLSSSHAELLAMDAWATALWIFISYQLYRNNIFFTV